MFLSGLISSLRKKDSPAATPPTGFCTLPRDILLCIADALSPETRICLALTCRGLYASLFLKPERPGLRLDAGEKQALLLLIEKDVPSLHYCYSCVKLRPWEHLRRYAISCTYYPKPVCSSRDKHDHFLVSGYFLYHTCARLVMTRRIPLSCIETEHFHLCKPYNVGKLQTWRAKIIEDELFLCTAYTIRQMDGNAGKLRQYFDLIGEEFCPHLRSYPSYVIPHLSHTHRIRQTDNPCDGSCFVACSATIERCTTCQTDFDIDIAWRGHEGWVVKIVAYRKLGKCLDPSEESWRSITAARFDTSHKGKRDFNQPGVRERWLEDEIARGRQILSGKFCG